jgi:choline-glycine betaine transporter
LYLGGLKALQTASVVASLPLLVVYGLLYASIIKTLKHWKPSNHEGKVLVASAQGAE